MFLTYSVTCYLLPKWWCERFVCCCSRGR